ncbi:endolytic transglycosylase MltG [Legionella bononiensis]|uniref:Endolytic murein transglycosylase n=1 Tax=Legionella bononiensis TaxID=2793102 RepID=A0ABS1WBC6_9GAMM|nr:endolytic transglycosylase MltG [Legionella bononiensis]MBL7480941.1 endolytic transglycosylase MltG [Legionella bononiensis]MBL7526649.1 endolytic transglycosylase MltG [Legionella bononiensis]MBL7564056.1 endolytic transglycosylase MltG [Legionella bononiensis]
MDSPRHKKLVVCIVAVFFMSFFIVSWNIYRLVQCPVIPKTDAAQIISIDRSASAYQVVQLLKEKKLIHSTKLLLLIIRFKGLSHQIKAGVYQITPGETVMELLQRIVAGDVITQKFTIIEGTTQQKVSQDLLNAHYLNYHPDDWLFIKANYPNAEGLLLADTYQYQGGSSSKTLLEQAHRNLMSYLNDSWSHRASDLPYRSAYELLIAASIIEKETAIPQERKLISGVMVNRLKKSMPLQMDPTVIYALGADYKGKLSHNDLLIKSPYNTYMYRGLPPTPIAMVGKESIDAAAHPQLSKYLYFVARGDGSHQFSETYEQQREAINLYQRKDY